MAMSTADILDKILTAPTLQQPKYRLTFMLISMHYMYFELIQLFYRADYTHGRIMSSCVCHVILWNV